MAGVTEDAGVSSLEEAEKAEPPAHGLGEAEVETENITEVLG